MRQTLLRKLPDARIEVIVNGVDANSTMPAKLRATIFFILLRLSREKAYRRWRRRSKKMRRRCR